jgi:hypothetical protein
LRNLYFFTVSPCHAQNFAALFELQAGAHVAPTNQTRKNMDILAIYTATITGLLAVGFWAVR